jgi:hypothetical protein
MSFVLVQVIVGGLLLGAVYALFSSGLTLVWGMMNIVNFAHGDFDHFYEVLDDHERDPGIVDVAYQIDRKLRLVGQSCHGFIEQEHPRLGR